MGVNRTILDPSIPEGEVRVALVVARYNQWITDRLRDGAVSAFERLVGDRGTLIEVPVPGAFETPVAAGAASKSVPAFHAIVCLGCVIRGETAHDRHIASAIVSSLAQIAVISGVPVGLGVLTVENADQAEARAGGVMGNKGEEAMEAALETFATIADLKRLGKDSLKEKADAIQ